MKVILYKLSLCEKFYYGTTTQKLKQRFNEHKSWNKWKLDWTNAKIEIIKEFECNNKREREQEEDIVLREFLGTENCLNTRRSFVTPEEKKEKGKIAMKNWHNKNIEHIKEYSKQRKQKKRKCEKCNIEISNPNFARHKKNCKVNIPTS